MLLIKQIQKSIKTIIETLKSSFSITANAWKTLIFSILFSLILTILLIIALALVYISFQDYLTISYINLAWLAITTIIYFILVALIQFLIINSLLNPNQNLKANLLQSKLYYKKFLILTFFIDVIFIIASLPLYTGFLLFFINLNLLGLLSLLLGYFLILVAGCLIIFSPYFLIEQDLHPLQALKNSYDLAKNNFLEILWKIFILSLILLILNWLSYYTYTLPLLLNFILNIIIFAIMIVLLFSYPIAIYKKLKK